ncbi:MAG: ATP-binding protein [Desulfobulbaceae bacterium]|nr:ATP-binding protein [Desulfobulbaceae bacterium]
MNNSGKNRRLDRKNRQAGGDIADLRRDAETRLQERTGSLTELSGRDKEELIHELGTYQIELEMQNEELRRTQEDLRDSRRRLADLFDFAPVGYFILDPKGIITSVNLTGASMLGWSGNDLPQKPFALFVARKDRDGLHLYLRETLRKRGRQVADLELLGKGNTPFHARLESIPVDDGAGRLEIRTSVIDITEQKKKELEITHLNSELRRANEDLLHYVFIISHDLQEPLRTITSFVQLLQRKYNDILDDKGKTFMRHIVESAGHMRMLLDDLLVYSSIEDSKPGRATVSLEKIVDNIRSSMAEKIKETGAVITTGSLPLVQGDETLFTGLLQNLISNSIKYRSASLPRIHVTAESRENKWIICVRDNGIGIDPQYAEQIFKIFQRLHLKNEYEGGTGIGLAICRKIVERYGGRIWVESSVQGAAFCFSLPKMDHYA